MGVFAGPDVSESGLVLALDAGNSKGFDDDENLYTYSKDFSSGWSANQVTIVANSALAPDGTNTAALITTNTVAAYNTIEQVPTLSTNTNYCYSVFVKLVSGSGTSSRVVFGSANDLVSPAYVSWGLQLDTLVETSDGNTPTIKGYISYPNGWYRIYMVLNTSTQTNALVSIRFGTGSADNVATFYVWGAQLERGSSPSPYYPTTATTKTRGSTLIDMTGRDNSGTLTNGPTYSSANGGSIVFDGTNDYVQKSSATINLSAGVTMEMMFKSTDMNSRAQGFMQFNSAGNNYINFYTGGNGFLRWETWVPVPTAGGAYTTPTTLSNNTWYHAVGTYTNGSSVLYINGVSVASASQTSGTYSSSYTGNIVIGEYAGYMSGNIAIAKLYNRALTAAEVQQNFNATRSRYGI